MFQGCSCTNTVTRARRQDTDTARGDQLIFHFSTSDFGRKAGCHSSACFLLVKAVHRYCRTAVTRSTEGPSFRAQRAAKAGKPLCKQPSWHYNHSVRFWSSHVKKHHLQFTEPFKRSTHQGSSLTWLSSSSERTKEKDREGIYKGISHQLLNGPIYP